MKIDKLLNGRRFVIECSTEELEILQSSLGSALATGHVDDDEKGRKMLDDFMMATGLLRKT